MKIKQRSLSRAAALLLVLLPACTMKSQEAPDFAGPSEFGKSINITVTPDAGHPDDISREDLVALDPSESTIIYRGFRDFVGPYVAHCHNLAHEDHAMMFGWTIVP